MPVVRASATACAGRLKLMAFDVDGVLTDGSLFYTDDGVEILTLPDGTPPAEELFAP